MFSGIALLVLVGAGLLLWSSSFSRSRPRDPRRRVTDDLLKLRKSLPEGVSIEHILENSDYWILPAGDATHTDGEVELVHKTTRERLTRKDLKASPKVFLVKEALKKPAELTRLKRPDGRTFIAVIEHLRAFQNDPDTQRQRLETGSVRTLETDDHLATAHLVVLERMDPIHEARVRVYLTSPESAMHFKPGDRFDVLDKGVHYANGVVEESSEESANSESGP